MTLLIGPKLQSGKPGLGRETKETHRPLWTEHQSVVCTDPSAGGAAAGALSQGTRPPGLMHGERQSLPAAGTAAGEGPSLDGHRDSEPKA